MSQMFYGDQNRWFIGLVIDVDDPLKLDRVKVRIQGVHTPDTTLIPNAVLKKWGSRMRVERFLPQTTLFRWA